MIRYQSKRTEMKLVRLSVIGGICVVGVYLLLLQLIQLERVNSRITSPLADSQVTVFAVVTSTEDKSKMNSQRLKNVVDTALKGTTGTYGIYIKNFKTGETYFSNEHKVYNPASLYKLWVMATIYKKIQNGQIAEDQVLQEDVAILNQKFNIDPEFAEKTEGVITMSVRDALEQMITISDNYAALLLTEEIGLSSVATFLKDLHFTESTVGTQGGSPESTPYDIARFFEQLYKGEFASSKYTAEMLSLLKNQKLTGGIPKYIPLEVSVAHKTGEIDEFKHDAGIVYTDNGDYIIVIMSESIYPLGAQERIALTSKEVFEHFTLAE